MCCQLFEKEHHVMVHLAILIAKARKQVNKKQCTCVASILNSKKTNPWKLSPKENRNQRSEMLHQLICPATETAGKGKIHLR